MTSSGHHIYYHSNSTNDSNSDQIVNPSSNTNSNNMSNTQFTNQQSGLPLEPLHSILYHLYPNSRLKNTFNEPNLSLQQMYQSSTQPQEYYNNEYPTLMNQSPLPLNQNLPSVDAQSQIVGLQQSPLGNYSGVNVLFLSSPDGSMRNSQSQASKVSHSPQSSNSTHLRNSSASTKRHSFDLDFVKPDKPRIATTYWEDEKTICYQVEAQGILVSRREDTNYVNGTKLLNVAGMTRGKRDGILKTEKTKTVVKVGAMNLKGVWIPFDRASEIARNEGIDGLLYPLFVKDLKSFYHEKGSMLRHDSYLKSLNNEDLSNITLSDVSLPTIQSTIIPSSNNNYQDKDVKSIEQHEYYEEKSHSPKDLKTEDA